MQHHEKYSRTIRRSESGLRCGCAAVAAVLACVAPCYAAHNRVTVMTYGDAAGTAARAERLETIMECTPTEGHTAVWNYAYDLAGRQTSVSLAVDGGSASTVATYTYDGVGRLASKSFGIAGNGTSEEYVYDARSNVTGVSGSGFTQTAYFGTNPVEGGASRYLSPCAASERQYGAEGEGVSQTMWTYRYDGFGRLAEASATDAVSAPDRALSEVLEYDRNSNILSLERVYAGVPVQLFGTKRVTDHAHIGNRWSNFAGLGWHDNIARWHDAILDRFTTPDPKAADYPSFSPYTHCAANPLRFTDPTGMVLVLTGDGEAVDNTIQLYNKMVGDGAKVYINDDGNIQISRTEKTSTEAENSVIDLLSSVINDKQTTTINIVDNSAEILIGDASKKTIDIGDIQALGDNGPTSSSAALLHETNEQFLVQAKGVELFKAHNSSIRMEAKYTGYAPFSTAHTDYSATFSGSSNNVPGQPKVLSQRHVRIGQPFGDKGSVTITLVLFLNGNINSKLYFR